MMETVVSAGVDRAEAPNVRLSLSNRPENVALVRQMLAGFAEAMDLDGSDLSDISTGTTEACNNVVLHAYGGAEGPLEIEVYAGLKEIEVVVHDHGSGIRPQISIANETPGIGLSVIEAVAQRAEFRRTADSGTEVRMAFATQRVNELEPLPADALELPAIVEAELASTMEIRIAPTHLARTILPRLLSMFAARAHFTTDRIADLQLVGDALVAHVPGAISGSQLSIGIHVEPHVLELRIAPLRAGHAGQLVVDSALEGLAPVIETLTDRQRVWTVGSHSDAEMLALRLTDRR